MADELTPQAPRRRPSVGTGPTVAALLTLSACSAQGAAPVVDDAPLTTVTIAVVSSLPVPELP